VIDEQAALAIARSAAQAEGWAFPEPVRIVLRKDWLGRAKRWEIQSGAGRRGTAGRFVIDATDGRIIEKGYIPR
jgi:hypothetical protein